MLSLRESENFYVGKINKLEGIIMLEIIRRKIFALAAIFLGLTLGTSIAFASITLDATSVTSNGALTLTGAADSTWDLGSGHNLSLQTNGGKVGIGTLDTTGIFSITHNPTSTATLNAELLSVTINPASPTSSRFLATSILFAVDGSSALTGAEIGGIRSYNDLLSTRSANVTGLSAFTARVENESTSGAVVTNAYLFRGEALRNVGTASLGNAYGVYLPTATKGSGSISTYYGVFVSAQVDPVIGYGLYVDAMTTATAYPFFYNGTSKIVITGPGNLGVGTTSPAHLLDVYSASATSTLRADTGSATTGGCIMLKDTDGSGYTQVVASNGVLTAKIATNPTACN